MARVQRHQTQKKEVYLQIHIEKEEGGVSMCSPLCHPHSTLTLIIIISSKNSWK